MDSMQVREPSFYGATARAVGIRRVHKVRGDGNCFWRATSRGHQWRKAKECTRRWGTGQPWQLQASMDNKEFNENWQSSMRKNGWAKPITMGMAACATCTAIMVWQFQHDQWEPTHAVVPDEYARVAHIAYREHHFEIPSVGSSERRTWQDWLSKQMQAWADEFASKQWDDMALTTDVRQCQLGKQPTSHTWVVGEKQKRSIDGQQHGPEQAGEKNQKRPIRAPTHT
eukprot:5408082-Amphidinium_carterae.2